MTGGAPPGPSVKALPEKVTLSPGVAAALSLSCTRWTTASTARHAATGTRKRKMERGVGRDIATNLHPFPRQALRPALERATMPGMDLGLQDKACVVTGASRGIGAAVTRLLEEEGANVLPVSRSEGFQADVTDPDAAERIVAECESRFGGIDVLVNNAGTSEMKAIDELEDADWQEQWELNVMASMRLMRAACPRMAERGEGRVVNVSSSSGKRPGQSNVAYSVAKAAQLSLSRSYADAWAGRGVLVNAVTPGIVASELWMGQDGLADQVAAAKGQTRDEVIAEKAAGQPVGRFGTEEEVAGIVVVLCSALASNVSGAAWSVDGGAVPVII
jgi:3-oxoacyl-[acyl-carrier protein] reductase